LAHTSKARNAFFSDLHAAQDAARAGIVSSRSLSNNNAWVIWSQFCKDLHLNPWLSDDVDPILLLQVFAVCYRTGKLAPRHKPVQSSTVEGALRAVGQTFAAMGTRDPQLRVTGKTEFRLARQLRSYSKSNDLPKPVKPIPIQVIQHAANLASQQNTADALAIINMTCLALFFLCQPGEYTAPTRENMPFRLWGVTFYIGMQCMLAHHATMDDIPHAAFVCLVFTSQKKLVLGKTIGLGLSGDPFTCPVLAVAQQVKRLQSHQAPLKKTCAPFIPTTKHTMSPPKDISTTLKASIMALGTVLEFDQTKVSARSLRASGAMALTLRNKRRLKI
jgi:hypothetical protein